MKLLHLTSPLIRSSDVVAAQRALTKNRFHDFDPGTIDGQYGPATAAATRRAQYWLGFRKGSINGAYGPDLHAKLTGAKLSKLQATRRRLRLWRARQTPKRTLALRLAHSQVGTTESPPDSNLQKYGAWYGMNGVPWCAQFVSYCFSHVGRPLKYAYCPYILADAIAGRNGLSIVKTPVPGDLALYDWNKDGVPDHVAFVAEPVSGGYFDDCGGNTSPTDASNGGQVLVQRRSVSDVRAFVRVS